MEFALIVPLLLTLALGIATFGRAYQVQSSLSMAAREGVRVMAIEKNASAAQSRAVNTASGLGITGVSTNVPSCSGTPASATMIVSYTLPSFLGVPISLSGKAVMRCGG